MLLAMLVFALRRSFSACFLLGAISLSGMLACSTNDTDRPNDSGGSSGGAGTSPEGGEGGVLGEGGIDGGVGGAAPGEVTDPERGTGGATVEPTSYEIEACPAGLVGFAEEVIDTDFGPGEDFGQDDLQKVLGGPRGGGCCSGSLDVVALGDGGSITLGFGQRTIVDGDGADFIVFENVFWAGGNEDAAFVEYGRVEVSEDGEHWFSFACDVHTGAGCAGTSPSLAHPEIDDVDVFDPSQAGGNAFDLADLALTEARYVRVSDLADDDMGFDLEAVAIVHGSCD